jgi:hypothetical protein
LFKVKDLPQVDLAATVTVPPAPQQQQQQEAKTKSPPPPPAAAAAMSQQSLDLNAMMADMMGTAASIEGAFCAAQRR